MLKGIGYGRSADWWSVGILVYDMLTGNVCVLMLCKESTDYWVALQPPFRSENEKTLHKRIISGKTVSKESYDPLAKVAPEKLKKVLDFIKSDL